jgi:two-component system NtrC family response regulator
VPLDDLPSPGGWTNLLFVDAPLTVLLIEDDQSSRELGSFNLRRVGYDVDVAVDGAEGLKMFDPERHAVVITDIRMPGVSGMEVLTTVRERAPTTPVIVVTAYGNVELAVEAMKEGAVDFIGKPFNRDHLRLAVDRAAEGWRMKRELDDLRIQARGVERPIVHRSGSLAKVLQQIDRAARSDAPVLLIGEHGTGKELLARRLHVRSRRGAGPFDAIRVSTLLGEQQAGELFGDAGQSAGAGQGRIERSSGGTVYLGDFHQLELAEQRALVRLLDARGQGGSSPAVSADVRFVFGSDLDLRAEVETGRLDRGLFMRAGVVEIRVPPLRERPEDVAPLTRHFVDEFAAGRTLEIPEALAEELEAREWYGNARELANVCERLVILCPGLQLRLEDLPPRRAPATEEPPSDPFENWPPLPEEGLSLVDLERRIIERVLSMKRGNVSAAAVYLGVPRHVLAYRMEKYGIKRKR